MAWVAPVALAVVFAWAGGAKLADRAGTAAGFAELHLPHPATLASVVPVVEVATAVLLIAGPRIGALVAGTLLLAFTVLLAHVVRAGSTVSCRCFGGVSVRPVSWRDVARNLMLLALVVVVLVAPPT